MNDEKIAALIAELRDTPLAPRDVRIAHELEAALQPARGDGAVDLICRQALIAIERTGIDSHGDRRYSGDNFARCIEIARDALDRDTAARATPVGVRVGDDWITVPRDPTQAMVNMALALQGEDAFLAKAPALTSALRKIYKAMIAAAPEPQA